MRFRKTDAKSDVTLPRRSTKGSAGYDMFSPYEVRIKPKKTVRVPLGVAVEGMDAGVVFLVFNRSGISLNHHVVIDNAVGVIDSDFNKEIICQLTNNSEEEFVIPKGGKICQGIFVRYELTDDDDANGERQGGLGSTGI